MENGARDFEDAVDEPAPPQTRRRTADFYRDSPALDRRIHISGLGSVGIFIAHALRGVPNPPPVTLIFSRYEQLNEWNESPQRLTLITEGDAETQDGFDAELVIPRARYHGEEVGSEADDMQTAGPQTRSGESNEPITSLILCAKAPYVLQHLSSVKHRLGNDSVILFMQNGMGTVEEVNREIFPDPQTRPYYMLGINSHGMQKSTGFQFSTVHSGFGNISLGILPHERDRVPNAPYMPEAKFRATDTEPAHVEPLEQLNPDYPPPISAKFRFTSNQRYLLRSLLRVPVLSAASFSPPDLLQMRLDKLAVNCIINPLTVMLDARNGAVLNNYAMTRTMRLLLSEISLVIRTLPELQYIPNVQQRFDPGRLETIVVSVAYKTQNNISSMLADSRLGALTEIDYINGWIVKRGEELGIRCLMNYMLVQMVKGKKLVVQRELEEGIPIVERKEGRLETNLDINQRLAGYTDSGEEGG